MCSTSEIYRSRLSGSPPVGIQWTLSKCWLTSLQVLSHFPSLCHLGFSLPLYSSTLPGLQLFPPQLLLDFPFLPFCPSLFPFPLPSFCPLLSSVSCLRPMSEIWDWNLSFLHRSEDSFQTTMGSYSASTQVNIHLFITKFVMEVTKIKETYLTCPSLLTMDCGFIWASCIL